MKLYYYYRIQRKDFFLYLGIELTACSFMPGCTIAQKHTRQKQI